MIPDALSAYGWPDGTSVTPGPRGALGQIWQVDTGAARYALKEIFAEPPSEERIRTELDFVARTGVRAPAGHPDLAGRYLHTTQDGTWLRLYDWVDLRPAPLSPDLLGALFARLHKRAPAAEPPVASWYERPPGTHPDLESLAEPSDPARLVLCHRDLHPENVLADAAGDLVVVDWDNLGPADPARELAMALFDWFPGDPDARAALYRAYVRAGGPARITAPADFTMLVSCRLNFLREQAQVAADQDADPRHRAWAERELAEMLPLLPTAAELAETLSLL
ncbi:MAG: phosphotransferase [Nonomuraea sp.]|nr:phosphotransferase [Nonomuraea sp.]